MVWTFWTMLMFVIGGVIALPFQSKGVNSFWCASMVIVMFILSISIAPIMFGHGHVPSKVEKFSARLDNNVAYQLITSSQEGSDFILVVKKFGTSDFHAIRTNTVPPELFTLVDGKPVALQK